MLVWEVTKHQGQHLRGGGSEATLEATMEKVSCPKTWNVKNDTLQMKLAVRGSEPGICKVGGQSRWAQYN